MAMSWRDVPMPTAVRNLPRDKRGFPVPWISEWEPGEARVGKLSWEHGAVAVQDMPFADCDDVVGVGVPDLGALCPKRQVKGMLERLCDVCGEFIPKGPIYFIGGDITIAGSTGFRECGLHYECALYAAQVCPALTTKGGKVLVYETAAYELQPEFLRRDERSEDGTSKDVFEGWDDVRLMILLRIEPMVLMALYAKPVNPTITSATEWVAAQLARGAA